MIAQDFIRTLCDRPFLIESALTNIVPERLKDLDRPYELLGGYVDCEKFRQEIYDI